jgi:Tfp pilus assembly protein FimV
LPVTARVRPLTDAPPALACWIMAISCGLATTNAATAPQASARSRATAGWRTSHGSSAAAASSPAITADSWLTSRLAPSTRPRITPWRTPGRRRSRTAASSVIGRNIVPSAMFRCCQSCHVSIEDRPNSAPAAIAPGSASHSRAARYIR